MASNFLFNFGNGKPKFLIISAITPLCIIPNDTINFFSKYYSDSFDYIDIMNFLGQSKNLKEAVLQFSTWFLEQQGKYDCIIGFSFGGVILQYILNIISNEKIILISSPTIMSGELQSKLLSLKNLLVKNQILKALQELQQYVSLNSHIVTNTCYTQQDLIIVKDRMLKGFNMILDMEENSVLGLKYIISIVGEKSNLVTIEDICLPPSNNYIVPQSGMRVLEDNPNAVRQIIDNFINF